MQFSHLQLIILAIVVGLATADVSRIPLRHRQFFNRNNEETDVVDMQAFRRSIQHMTKRYNEENKSLKKRIVDESVLTRPIDQAFSQAEDTIQNRLSGIIEKMANKFSTNPSRAKTLKASHETKTTSKAGRYSGATGTSNTKLALQDVVLSGQLDFEYVAQVSIGTPPQTFYLDADLGSSDLWVIDSTCTSADCGATVHSTFRSNESSSDVPINGKKFDLSYTIGDVSGCYVRETVQLGSITLHKQTIGLANETSPDWSTDKASGVLGLGFRALTSANQRPVIQNLATQGKLKDKIIAFAFGRAKSGTVSKSEMRIGSIAKKLIKGEISWYNVPKAAYWQIPMKSFTAGSSRGITDVNVIFDTGSTLISAPYELASIFWKGVEGSKLSDDGTYYSFPCSTKIDAKFTLPDGKSFAISELDMNIGKESSGSSRCLGALVNAGGPGQLIFGLAGMKNFYSIFDFGQNRVGLAKHNL